MIVWRFRVNSEIFIFKFKLVPQGDANNLHLEPVDDYSATWKKICEKFIRVNGVSFICGDPFEPVVVSEAEGAVSYRISENNIVIEELGTFFSDSELEFDVLERKLEQEQIGSLVKAIRDCSGDMKIHTVIETSFSGNIYLTAPFKDWKRDLRRNSLDSHKLIYVENGFEAVAHVFKAPNDSLTFPCQIDTNVFVDKEIKTFMRFKAKESPFSSRLYSQIVISMLKKSFNYELMANGHFSVLKLEQDVLKSFLSRQCFPNRNLVLAPIHHVCQSSGSGKSKIAFELLKRHFGFYLVLRGEGQSGYPFKNDLSVELDKLITDCYDFPSEDKKYSDSTAGKILNFFARIISKYFSDLIEKCLTESMESAVKSLGNRFEDNEKVDFCLMNQDKMESIYRKICGLNENQTIAIKHVSFSISEICRDPKKIFVNTPSDKEGEICQVLVSNLLRFPFLFVIDGISYLSKLREEDYYANVKNRYEVFVRALSFLKNTTNIVFLTLGTRITGIHPESQLMKEERQLPKPLIFSSNLNILSKEFPVHRVRPTYKMVLNPIYFKYLATLGQGIWSSLPFCSIISTGETKIINGTSESGDYIQALWMILMGVAANPTSSTARDILANHMGTLIDVSDDLKHLLVMYPPEPVIAMIAHKCIDEIHNDRLFSVFESRFQDFDIRRSETAKIFGGMIILRAIWKSKNEADNFNRYSGYENQLEQIKEEAPDLNDIWERHEHILEEVNERRKIQAEIDSLKMQAGIFHLKTSEIVKDPANKNVCQRIEELKVKLESYTVESKVKYISCYKVHTVESFLKILLSDFDLNLEKNFGLPKIILEGLVNGNQMVNLDNFSGYMLYGFKQFNPEKPALADERIADNSRFILTEDLIRLCFVMQQVIRFPVGYYGLDFAIPVLLKNGNFTFIGVQIKRANANSSDDVYKMRAALHLVKCPLSNCGGKLNCSHCMQNEKLRVIYENQISIILSLDEPGTFVQFSEGERAFEGCTPNAKEHLKTVFETCNGTRGEAEMGQCRSSSFTEPLITMRKRIKNDILLLKSLWMDKYVDANAIELPKGVKFRDDGYLHRQFCISMRGWNNFRGLFADFDSSTKIAQKLMSPKGLIRHFPRAQRDPETMRKIVSELSLNFPLVSEEVRLARGEKSWLDDINSQVKREWRSTKLIDYQAKPTVTGGDDEKELLGRKRRAEN